MWSGGILTLEEKVEKTVAITKNYTLIYNTNCYTCSVYIHQKALNYHCHSRHT